MFFLKSEPKATHTHSEEDGRCVDISKDHLKHSGRNFNSGHSTVLCTCIHVILNKDVHQQKKIKNTPSLVIHVWSVQSPTKYTRGPDIGVIQCHSDDTAMHLAWFTNGGG